MGRDVGARCAHLHDARVRHAAASQSASAQLLYSCLYMSAALVLRPASTHVNFAISVPKSAQLQAAFHSAPACQTAVLHVHPFYYCRSLRSLVVLPEHWCAGLPGTMFIAPAGYQHTPLSTRPLPHANPAGKLTTCTCNPILIALTSWRQLHPSLQAQQFSYVCCSSQSQHASAPSSYAAAHHI